MIAVVSFGGLGLQWYMTVSITDVALPFLHNPVRYLFYTIVGFVVMVAVCYVDYTRIAYRAKELLIIYYIFMIVSVLSGPMVNGVNYAGIWILGIYFDVRMSVFLFIPLYCAVVYSYEGQFCFRSSAECIFLNLVLLIRQCGLRS